MYKKFIAPVLVLALIAGSATAQEKKEVEKKKEVIIRKDGGKEEKMIIVVDGDNVTINGKPVEGDDAQKVIIRKRMAPGDNDKVRMFKGGAASNMNFFQHDDMEKHAFLGVMTEKTDGGVKITEVTKNSAAEKAGLKKDDIITAIDGKKVETHDALSEVITAHKPGDKAEITYKRGGKEAKTTATLAEHQMKRFEFKMDNDFMHDLPMAPGALRIKGFNWTSKPKIGLQIQDLEEGKGVKVKDVDEETPAAKAGFKEGDIITKVNDKDVENVDAVKSEIKDLKDGDTIKFTYKRDGKVQTVDVKIPKKLKTIDL